MTLPPAFQDSDHVLHGRFPPWGAAGRILGVSAPDCLEIGPSSVDRHGRVRRGFWRHYYDDLGLDWALDNPGEAVTASQLRRAIGRSARPLVLWRQPAFSGVLFTWWALDALAGTRRDVWLADGSLGGKQGMDEAEQRLSRAQPLSSAERRAGGNRWRAFASGHLARIPTRDAEQDWLSASRSASFLFPRVSGKSLHLSQFDAVLLSSFEEWTRPAETVSRETVDVLFAFGDLLIEFRARQWTRSDAGLPALESRRIAEGRSVFRRHAYRLTSEGRRRLERGLSHVGEAPTFEVGGATAYARKRPWTVVEDENGWAWRRADT